VFGMCWQSLGMIRPVLGELFQKSGFLGVSLFFVMLDMGASCTLVL